MSRIVTIVGSTSETSRTRPLAVDIQRQVAARTGAGTHIVDLAVLLAHLAARSPAEAGRSRAEALAAIVKPA